MSADSLYQRVGGQEFFDRLVEYFYEGVETDFVLRSLYPRDLSEAKNHLALFFAQYWGGPATYNEVRGHPRLRMRHVDFDITTEIRDRWLTQMNAALANCRPAINDEDFAEFSAYIDVAAHQLRNR